MVAALNHFYSKLTQVIVQHGIVDKLIGDAVMGLYFATHGRRALCRCNGERRSHDTGVTTTTSSVVVIVLYVDDDDPPTLWEPGTAASEPIYMK
jgi:hypothetical protein